MHRWAVLGLLLWSVQGRAQSGIDAEVAAVYPQAEALYLDLHRHPELSFHEQRTAETLAAGLRRLGFEVTTGVGRTGVVGLLKNGDGPVVMLRTELDALPVVEETGLPYASSVRTKDDNGAEVGVAHACGHDVHMAAWMATARLMASTRNRWRGTLELIGQPAEEFGGGAVAMLADGLFTRFPRPDYAIAVHDDARYPAGLIGYNPGPVLASVDTVNVTIYGRGGHGARPEAAVDPIVIAARTVIALQTIVARENSPFDPAVITVGSIHGGTRPNIIPPEVKLEITVRSMREPVRQHLLEAIDRIVKAEALAAAAPKPPLVERIQPSAALSNDPELVRRVTAALARELGPQRIQEIPPEMASEDFSEFERAGVPSLFLRIGAVKQSTYDGVQKPGGAPLVSLHSPLFAPDPQPTIEAAAAAELVALRELMPAERR
jgi:amidohydrolase